MIEIPYSVKIIDDPATDLIVLLAKSQYQGKPCNGIKSISRNELKEALLGEGRYNIIGWNINRLTKEIRHLLEQEVIDPVLKLEEIILPSGWDTYRGPNVLINQQTEREKDFEGLTEQHDTTEEKD